MYKHRITLNRKQKTKIFLLVVGIIAAALLLVPALRFFAGAQDSPQLRDSHVLQYTESDIVQLMNEALNSDAKRSNQG